MSNFISWNRTNLPRKTFSHAVLILCLFVCCQCFLWSQNVEKIPSTQELEQILEFLAQSTGAAPSLDLLEYYHTNPLRLLTASIRDIQTLPSISLETAIALKRWVKKYPETNYTALQDSLALSPAQIAILRYCTVLGRSETQQSQSEEIVSGKPLTVTAPAQPPVVKVQPNLFPTTAFWYRARTRFWANPQRGSTPDATPSQQFQGSALELFQRLTATFRADSAVFFEANITVAKDAGEQSAADYLSGYVRAEFGAESARTSIVAGDYLIKSGLGTMLWSIFANRKGADVISPVMEVSQNLIPYRSSTEQQFFRGVAAQHSRALSPNLSLRLIGWASVQARSARIDSARDVATSLDFDGLFRTRSELATRNTLRESIVGVSAEVTGQNESARNNTTQNEVGSDMDRGKFGWNWSLGASVFSLDYDKLIASRSVMVFPQQRGVLTTLYGTLARENIVVGSEISQDGAGNVGGRVAAELRLKSLELAASARIYPTEFRSPFGMNFGENPKPTNEAGLYVGAIWKELPKLRINAYADAYTTLSSTATVPAQVRGVDIFTETTWDALPNLQGVMRLRHETKTDVLTLGSGRTSRRVVYGRGRTGLRLQGTLTVSDALRVQARYEAAFVSYEGNQPPEIGMLGFVGASWSPIEWLHLTGRMVAFRTDSFDSALWQYETTIQGTLSNPPLYGQGIRAYLLLEAEPLPRAVLAVRGSLTRRFDVSTLGSGATQINSNTDAQLVVQVDIRF